MGVAVAVGSLLLDWDPRRSLSNEEDRDGEEGKEAHREAPTCAGESVEGDSRREDQANPEETTGPTAGQDRPASEEGPDGSGRGRVAR
jgi:hypothetical protein